MSHTGINLLELFRTTITQDIVGSRRLHYNLADLYNLSLEVRLALLDLIRLNRIHVFEGNVYAVGFQIDGRSLNGGYDLRNAYVRTYVNTDDVNQYYITDIATGYSSSYFVTNTGQVFASGSNMRYELGLGPEVTSIYLGKAKQVDTSNIGDDPIIKVSAGLNYTLFLTKSGKVFGSGNNGVDGTDNYQTPTQINIPNIDNDPIIDVSAGSSHYLLLTKSGKSFSFGYSSFGALADGGDSKQTIEVPQPIDTTNIGDDLIVQVAAGLISMFLTKSGKVYTSGLYSLTGQGPNDNDVWDISTPTMIDTYYIGDDPIIKVVTESDSSFVITESGRVFAFGDSNYGSLGNGITYRYDIITPEEINMTNIGDKRIIDVAPEHDHSLFLTEDGKVYATGSTESNKMGHFEDDAYYMSDDDDYAYDEYVANSDRYIAVPTLVDIPKINNKPVVAIATGAEHSLFLV